MEIVTITEARRRLHGALSSYQKETEEVTPEADRRPHHRQRHYGRPSLSAVP